MLPAIPILTDLISKRATIWRWKRGNFFGTDTSLEVLLEKLAADAVERGATFISLYYGEDVSEEDAQKAADAFQTDVPNAEVAVLPGGQPVYYYIISME